MKITTPEFKRILTHMKAKDFRKNMNTHVHVSPEGPMSVAEAHSQAVRNDLKIFGCVLHNNTNGLERAPKSDTLIDVSGPELDCWYPVNKKGEGVRIHILGLNVDMDNPKLKKFQKKVIDFKKKTQDRVCIFPEEMKEAPSSKEAIEVIKEAGGLSSLAHPAITRVLRIRPMIRGLKKEGLDAVEVYYPYKELLKLRKFQGKKYNVNIARAKSLGLPSFVKRMNLLCTAGTDSHTDDINRTFDKRY